MFTVVSYDIVQDRRRTKAHDLLKGYGTRVQYSVFECYLSTRQLAQVQQSLARLIDPMTDSVRFYLLDRAAMRRIQVMGIGQVSAERHYYLI